MRALLDTHSFLWFVGGDARLSAPARQTIEDLGNEIFISTASLWEIAIKVRLGKLNLGAPYEQFIPEELYQILVESSRIVRVGCSLRREINSLRSNRFRSSGSTPPFGDG